MRNLKKILALVLALVMSFSVMTVSSAAFKDEAKISADYAQSIEVLNAIGVFRGDENGKFNPQKNITRAEVAAIIYRITTGDTDDTQAGFYADLNMFSDVNSKDWFAGYVNYCASAEFIKGRGNGTFDPQGNITGYDALTMILRAIGYDQNGEFTGEGYTVKVAQIAQERHITDSLKNVALGSAASREVIAEILFNTITIPQVSYTLAFGYSIYANPMQQDGKGVANDSLAYENFRLCDTAEILRDDWGVPTILTWFIDLKNNTDATYKTFDSKDQPLIYAEVTPVYDSKVAAAECDVAKAMGLTKNAKISTIRVNATVVDNSNYSYNNVKFDREINLTDTRTLVGAQGRWTRIYNLAPDYYEVVMMDEFLAQVTDVTELTYDRNGHVKAPATVTLNVYDRTWANSQVDTTIIWENYSSNFEYVKGQTMLMYHKATVSGTIVPGTKDVAELFEIIGAPEYHIGYQSALTTRASRVVDGTEYPTAIQFNLDECGTDIYSPYVWYFDTEGNVIAVTEYVAEYDFEYGVITAIKWVDEFNTLTNGYALANITYIDGTTGTVKIAAINGYAVEGVEGKNAAYMVYDGVDKNGNDVYRNFVSSTTQYNKDTYTYNRLYGMYYDAAGRAYLYVTDGPFAKGETVNGVSTIKGTGYYAGHTTQFLVLTYDANGLPVFETYTGINEIPSYNPATMWIQGDEQKVADYVYIINPTAYSNAKAYTDTFFVYDTRDLTIHTDLYTGVKTVIGGMVNGETATFSTLSNDVINAIYANAGRVVVLHHAKNGLVTDVSAVTENYLSAEDAHDGNDIVYAGFAGHAYINDGILFTVVEGKLTGSYDLTGAEVITEYRNLEDTIAFAKKTGDAFEPAYLYIAYTYKTNTKAAVTIYITTRSGITNSMLTAEIDAAAAKVEEINAALNEKLGLNTASYADMTVEELKAELVKAIAALEKAIAEAPKGAVVDTKALNKVIAAATETVANVEIEIKVADVSLTYAVDADVKAVVVAAVAEKVVADKAVAELIALGAEVEIETKFDFADAAETNAITFVVTITYGETEMEYEVVVNVTAKVAVAAEEAK